MSGYLVLTLLFAASQAATLTPPIPNNGADTSSVAPPDLVTNTPDALTPMVTDTSAAMTNTSGPMMPGTAATMVTDAPVSSEVTSGVSTTEMANDTMPCNPSLAQIQGVFNYTNAPEFKELSENQQIVIYELLAAGEACKLEAFITPQTAQRVFLLMEDLPLKYVYLFVSFLARNLEAEGVVVPV